MLRVDGITRLDGPGQNIERALDRFIFAAIVLETLSVVLLSAGGIYALMSFTITRRRREIGIRSALGADARRVLGSVLRRAAGQIAGGIAIGTTIAGALQWGAGGGVLAAEDGILLVAVAGLMAAVGVLAALGPARRALRIQPTEALKGE
jgi:ABC-type antimicrobial peptide transport system permease subunit